jgi:hypothetical protein
MKLLMSHIDTIIHSTLNVAHKIRNDNKNIFMESILNR